MTDSIEVAFRQGLAEGAFELFYQPQMSNDGGAMTGVEAVARWRNLDGSVTGPVSFISALEQRGLITELSMHLFPKVCAAAARWPQLTVAFNLSPMDFRRRDLVQFLIEAAAAAGVATERIEIEITEGLFFDDPDRAEVMLARLREVGFPVALDDFGTGYSSLAYLLRFPVSKIKIDRSFVKDVPQSIKAASIVHAVIALARAIGLKVVAEGVETNAQRAFLKAAGCHNLQGYLFSPPVSADDIDMLLGGRPVLPP